MDILEMVVRARTTVRNSDILIGGVLALLVSANAILVFIFGLAGVQGKPLVTAGYLAASEILLFCLTFRSIRLQATDYLFCAFVLSIILSFALNVTTFAPKQIALLAIALGSYPACRYLSFESPGVRETFAAMTGAIVSLGAVLAVYAMITQWDGPYARPVVLGVTDAATHFFLMICGLMIFAVTAGGLDRQRSLLLSAFLFLPAAIFSASHVRATFIAITATLIFALIISESKQRRYFAVVIGTLLVAIAIGQVPAHFRDKAMAERQAARETMTRETMTSEAPPPQPEAHPRAASRGVLVPSCTTTAKISDSIAMRMMALQDAIKLVPAAGAFGFGFGAFDHISCVAIEVHNSYLQALIEFGWIGGLCFCAAIAIALIGLWPFFRGSNEARFALYGLVYMAMLSVPHGILGEDRMLFAILGLAVGVHERCTLKRKALHSLDTAAGPDGSKSAPT